VALAELLLAMAADAALFPVGHTIYLRYGFTDATPTAAEFANSERRRIAVSSVWLLL